MANCLIALGANLGDPRGQLAAALAQLRAHAEIRVLQVSCFRETQPIGGPAGQAPFLNAAALLETSLSPLAILDVLQSVEAALGRTRNIRWAARSLDLDLLLYDQLSLANPRLCIPHPRMSFRRFVLEPAAEIAPDWVVPGIGRTLGELLSHLDGAPPYVAITGSIGAGKSSLAAAIAGECDGRLVCESLDSALLTPFYADPAGRGWSTEIRFLDERNELLSQAMPVSENPANDYKQQWLISDFWFDQSLAFARVWLAEREFAHYEQRWRSMRENAQLRTPRLLVVLEAPGETLLARVQTRGRDYEQQLTATRLEQLQQSILAVIDQLQPGPILRLDARDPQHALTETTAAILATQ
jgi:2-amino-4-hydroxy-6-hydroxymethyldihydropteridine diphosphokinase